MAIKVLKSGTEVLKSIGDFTDVNGTFLGYNHVSSIHQEGTVLADSDVSPALHDILDNEDHPQHERLSKLLEKTGAKPKVVLSEPYPGYDDADEDEILAALFVLPSDTVSAVKTYEEANEGRAAILEYNKGRGEGPYDRLQGKVGSPTVEGAEGKVAADVAAETVEQSVEVAAKRKAGTKRKAGDATPGPSSGEQQVTPAESDAGKSGEDDAEAGAKTRAAAKK